MKKDDRLTQAGLDERASLPTAETTTAQGFSVPDAKTADAHTALADAVAESVPPQTAGRLTRAQREGVAKLLSGLKGEDRTLLTTVVHDLTDGWTWGQIEKLTERRSARRGLFEDIAEAVTLWRDAFPVAARTVDMILEHPDFLDLTTGRNASVEGCEAAKVASRLSAPKESRLAGLTPAQVVGEDGRRVANQLIAWWGVFRAEEMFARKGFWAAFSQGINLSYSVTRILRETAARFVGEPLANTPAEWVFLRHLSALYFDGSHIPVGDATLWAITVEGEYRKLVGAKSK